jgi:DNA-binding response OmpR family regulator
MNPVPKIMVVDDEVGICKNVEKILKKGNYAVTHAASAKEALAIMAKESFSLLISDIVMPEMNGLELLKMVKKEWPVTRAVMMTAYASTDTAVKAIRMGALDYIPKPFTPDELRATVEKALSGKLVEARISERERESINIIDVDIPFDGDEVATITGKAYTDTLGPSDMPVVEVRMPENLEGFCEVGNMVCDIFKKLGATCKAGTKNAACPQLAKKKKKATAAKTVDTKKLIGIDQPFDYDEVAAVSGPEYIHNLRSDGVSIPYYEDLKANVTRLIERNRIDVDVPFDVDEVAKATGEDYATHATRTDVPMVEITASETVEGFCQVGAMVCDIFKKLGATCKAGTKSGACPQLAKRKRAASKKAAADTAPLIAPDMPFDFDEVVRVTGREYVDHLIYDGTVQMPYATLKANMQKMMAAEKREAAPPRADKAQTQADILVVDDEVAVNNNIRKILTKKGYRVDQAVSRDEALERIASQKYSLVLLDLRIPGVKGLALLEAVMHRNPDAKVIMITGYASIETAVAAARMGAVDYLPKPFTPDEIRNATERAFQLAA